MFSFACKNKKFGSNTCGRAALRVSCIVNLACISDRVMVPSRPVYGSWRACLWLSLEGNPLELRPSSAQPVCHLVPQQGRVAQVFIDRIGGHLGDVLCCLGLNVECDQGIRHQVMDRLKSLIPDKVLAIIEESVV